MKKGTSISDHSLIFRRTPSIHRKFHCSEQVFWHQLPYPHSDDFEVCVGYARGHGCVKQHCHEDFIELVLVTRGRAINFLEDKDYTIRKGAVFVIHPGQRHGYSDTKGLDLFNICIRESVLRQLPMPLLTMPGYLAIFQVEPTFRQKRSLESLLVLPDRKLIEVAQSADRLRKLLESRTLLDQIRARAIFTDFIANLVAHYQAYSSSEIKPLSFRFAKVLAFIEKHSSEPISVEDIAQNAGFSLRSLHRVCLDYMGIPPKKLLMSVRLHRAKEMLKQGTTNITEIAYTVGFSDSNHFSKYFRKETGLSPRKFRINYKNLS